MDEKKKEATEYGAGSNSLEGNKPQYAELKEILASLDGSTDDSFLLKVVEYINKNKQDGEDKDVKAKK